MWISDCYSSKGLGSDLPCDSQWGKLGKKKKDNWNDFWRDHFQRKPKLFQTCCSYNLRSFGYFFWSFYLKEKHGFLNLALFPFRLFRLWMHLHNSLGMLYVRVLHNEGAEVLHIHVLCLLLIVAGLASLVRLSNCKRCKVDFILATNFPAPPSMWGPFFLQKHRCSSSVIQPQEHRSFYMTLIENTTRKTLKI